MSEMTTPGAAGWIEHSGPDHAAAQKFYADVVGWTIAGMPMQDGSSYPGIMMGEQPIGGFSPRSDDEGRWTIFITVADVDAAVARAKAGGASVVAEPMDAPGVGRMATLTDPHGARFALITYESMRQ